MGAGSAARAAAHQQPQARREDGTGCHVRAIAHDPVTSASMSRGCPAASHVPCGFFRVDSRKTSRGRFALVESRAPRRRGLSYCRPFVLRQPGERADGIPSGSPAQEDDAGRKARPARAARRRPQQVAQFAPRRRRTRARARRRASGPICTSPAPSRSRNCRRSRSRNRGSAFRCCLPWTWCTAIARFSRCRWRWPPPGRRRAQERAARVAADEATSAGLHWTFAPMIDIARDPRWGRIVEGAGEDPYLGARMAVAQVNGLPGRQHAAPGFAHGNRQAFRRLRRRHRRARLQQRRPLRAHAAGSLSTAVLRRGARRLGLVHGGVQRHRRRSDHGEPRSAARHCCASAGAGRACMVSDWGAIGELLNHGVAADRAAAACSRSTHPSTWTWWAACSPTISRTRSRRIPRGSNYSTKRCCASCA